MKRCAIDLMAIKEMHIKTTIYHYTVMAKIKSLKVVTIANTDEDVEKLDLSF